MAIDITNVQKTVLGVNYLGSNGGAEVDAFCKSRFPDKEVCLIQGDPSEDPNAIYNKLVAELNQKEIQVGGKNCILVFFVDYTVELEKTIGAVLWLLGDVLRKKLVVNVEAVLQFAYVGEMSQHDTEIPRKNIKTALNQNNKKESYDNYRLCIVGKPALQSRESNHWKATVVFVDLLRRCLSLQDYLPVTGSLGKNDICFLRYGEFRESDYQKLLDEKNRLEALLTKTGENKLNALVDAKRSEMIQYLEQEYPIDGSLHPQHPDMIVEDPDKLIILPWMTNTRNAAREGRNPAYKEAQSKTKSAVLTTGFWLGSQIKNWFDEQISNVGQTLPKLFEDANVGISLKRNLVKMRSALRMVEYPDPGPMPSLMLNYSEQGAAQEIGEYLTYIRNSSIREGVERYGRALIEAFEAIPQSDFVQEEADLKRARDRASVALADADDIAQFCQRVVLEDPPEAVFEISPIMKVENAKAIMCRERVVEVAEKKAMLGKVQVHSVDENLCGIVKFDDAPVKAVMISCVACEDRNRDQILDQLLPGGSEFDDFDF